MDIVCTEDQQTVIAVPETAEVTTQMSGPARGSSTLCLDNGVVERGGGAVQLPLCSSSEHHKIFHLSDLCSLIEKGRLARRQTEQMSVLPTQLHPIHSDLCRPSPKENGPHSGQTREEGEKLQAV